MKAYVKGFVCILAAVIASPVSGSTPLPRDDNNTYGQFPNGMNYIVRKHTNPPDRVALYMHVKAGSLEEMKDQNGLAHFLEHMCFNGSEHFPPGELIPTMSKLGMTFGAHTNAHTNYHETVYKLFMPDNKPETVELGLKVLGDWASGLLLSSEEIENERGVILEEYRRGLGAMERIRKEFMNSVFEGTRLAEHDVIGKEEQIKDFTREQFVEYWNAWYRPENMTFIMVGDLDVQEMIEKAKPFLGEFKARGETRERLGGQIKLVNQPRAFSFKDAEQVMGIVQMLVVKKPRPPIKTYADFKFNETENLGTWIVSRRYQELVQKGEASYLAAACGVQDVFNEAILALAYAAGTPDNWNKMLEQLVVELDRALEHGFTEQELDLARKTFISNAERAVQTEPTLDARTIVGSIASDIGLKHPILSAQQRLDLTKKAMEEITVEDVNKVFRDNYKSDYYTYALVMPDREGVEVPSDEEIQAAAAEAWAKQTESKKDEEQIVQLIEKLPEPGKVVQKQTDPELKVTTAELGNGVLMHHYYSDYKKNQAWITILLTGGTLQETKQNRGVSDVASLVNATSKYTSTQISDYMSPKKVSVRGGVGTDAATLRISGDPAELETGMQLAYLYLTDGKIEQSALDVWKRATVQALEEREKTPYGHFAMAMEKTFYANDPRMVELTEKQINGLTVEDGEKWMKQIIENAAIEVTVVGDIQWDQAEALVTRYVGSLPQRSPGAWKSLDHLRTIQGREDGPIVDNVTFESITPKAFSYAGFLGVARDNTEDIRKMNVAARIVHERMIKRIREEERLVYSIGCRHFPDGALDGTGMISAGSTTDPENAQKLADTVLEMLERFAKDGPTEEELATAKKQIATDLDKSMKEPDWWLDRLHDMHYRGHDLDEIKQLPDVYQKYTVSDIHETAKKYIKPDRRVRFTVIPETKASEESTSEEMEEAAVE